MSAFAVIQFHVLLDRVLEFLLLLVLLVTKAEDEVHDEDLVSDDQHNV
jgi:hypothetical protein